MFDAGIADVHSIFELISEKLKRLCKIAAAESKVTKELGRDAVVLVVVTNEESNSRIVDFYKQHAYFGYKTVIFYKQTHLPVCDEQGKMHFRNRGHLLVAPNGNGAIFVAESWKEVVQQLKKCGVEHLQVTGIDNILCKWGDPRMLGVLLAGGGGRDVVCKFVSKKHAHEKVGVFALVDGKPSVIEYSVIGKDLSEKKNEEGELQYKHANILNFMMKLQWLEDQVMCEAHREALNMMYNVSIKDVKHMHLQDFSVVQSKAVKFELFVHECLSLCAAGRFVLLECDRSEEFAPIKNSLKEPADNPHTALDLYVKYHQQLLLQHHYKFKDTADVHDGCFIHPSVSYDGEQLPPPPASILELPFVLK